MNIYFYKSNTCTPIIIYVLYKIHKIEMRKWTLFSMVYLLFVNSIVPIFVANKNYNVSPESNVTEQVRSD